MNTYEIICDEMYTFTRNVIAYMNFIYTYILFLNRIPRNEMQYTISALHYQI